MSDPYRTACPPPLEPIYLACEDSSLYVVNADILFRCEGCKAEWRLSEVFNLSSASESAAFHHIQLAWSYKHHGCR